MGQKVNPISNRLGIIRGWDSNWFGGKNFGDNLLEDKKIRTYFDKRLEKASVFSYRNRTNIEACYYHYLYSSPWIGDWKGWSGRRQT